MPLTPSISLRLSTEMCDGVLDWQQPHLSLRNNCSFLYVRAWNS